ncbi:MAG: DUF697 domain-containing protein [Magnetococcales bacterium]|nr:DUF697 domain-containing protein [Magnetococcales bacterium]MBF0113756.1 DUF697 domain-containing protein [Magnetococcales bacterium]
MRFSHPWIASPDLATVNGATNRHTQPAPPQGRLPDTTRRVEPDIFNDTPPALERTEHCASEPETDHPTVQRHPSWRLPGLLTFLIVSMLTASSVQLTSQMWQWHPILGAIFAMLLCGITGTLLTILWREWQQWRQLRKVTSWQNQGDQLLDRESYGHAYPLLRRLLHFYRGRSDLRLGLESFQREVDDDMEDAEQVALFSARVLSQIDGQAYPVVLRHASGSALLATVTPLLWLDALLFIWRSLNMIQEIAALYGLRLSKLNAALLLKDNLGSLLGAGAADLAAHGITQQVTDSLTAVLAARAGQGVANGLYMARIGLESMHACRPLPFLDDEQPSLARIAKALQQEVKNGLTSTAQKFFGGETKK